MGFSAMNRPWTTSQYFRRCSSSPEANMQKQLRRLFCVVVGTKGLTWKPMSSVATRPPFSKNNLARVIVYLYFLGEQKRKKNRRKSRELGFNSLTAIRVLAGSKNSPPVGFLLQEQYRKYRNIQHNNQQTSPPWWCHLPLLRCGIYGSAQSEAGNLFERGWARAVWLGLVLTA